MNHILPVREVSLCHVQHDAAKWPPKRGAGAVPVASLPRSSMPALASAFVHPRALSRTASSVRAGRKLRPTGHSARASPSSQPSTAAPVFHSLQNEHRHASQPQLTGENRPTGPPPAITTSYTIHALPICNCSGLILMGGRFGGRHTAKTRSAIRELVRRARLQPCRTEPQPVSAFGV